MTLDEKTELIRNRVCAAYGALNCPISAKIAGAIAEQEQAAHVLESDLELVEKLIFAYQEGRLTAEQVGRLWTRPDTALENWPRLVGAATGHRKLLARLTRKPEPVLQYEDPAGKYPPRVSLREAAEANLGYPDYQEPGQAEWAMLAEVQQRMEGMKTTP